MDVKNVNKKVLNLVNSRLFGNNLFISQMFQPLGQPDESNVHSARASNGSQVIGNLCAREELNKLKFMFMLLRDVLSLKIWEAIK